VAKYTVQFPEDLDKLLERLSAEEHTSKEDVIRRALALYNFVQQEAVTKKRKLSITDDQNTVLKDIVFD